MNEIYLESDLYRRTDLVWAAGKEEAFSTEFGSEKQPIQAILMFSDPENWYIDLQLITDVITSGINSPSSILIFPAQ